jgi:quercetin dioxygenase-like cupin family protein
MSALETLLKTFDAPDEVRVFEKGRLELLRLGPMVIGRATYEPGWKWSQHVGPTAGTPLCEVEHVGVVLTGRAAVRMRDGTERILEAGAAFYVPPGHDSWVVGDERYVSLHVLGADAYAQGPGRESLSA